MPESEPKIIEERGPFKVTDREVKHDRFSMQLIADKVIRPDGSPGEYFWINFPRQAVLIFPIDEKGNIYLAEEFDYVANEYSPVVAGGVIDEGESAVDAAKRELQEELGIEVEPQVWYIDTTKEVTSRVNNQTHLFMAKVKSVGKANLEAGEDIRMKKVPIEKAYQMVLNREIQTATVKTGIFQIRNFLQSLRDLSR